MSTPSPTPSEKHIWMAASIQTCAGQGDRQSGGERSLWGPSQPKDRERSWGGPTDGRTFAARGSKEQGQT